MKRVSFLLLLLCSFLPVVCHAQVQTGTPPFGSFGGGPDVINLANLNAHLTIPVINKQGRGLNFVYNITYDSAVWYPLSEGDGELWEPVANWGLNGTSFGYIGMTAVVTTPCINRQTLDQTGQVTEYRWSYIDAANTSHGFGTTNQVSGTITNTNCSGDSTTSIDSQAVDGSGYTLSATGATFQGLTGPGGQQMSSLPINGPSSANVTAIDRNGNEITSNASSVFTDTLGTTVFTVAGSGTPSSPITLTYTAPSGASAVYTEKFTNQTVQTNFGCSSVAEYGPTSQYLVSEIDLPDDNPNGTRDRYTFTYEATPGYAENVTGRIASITLPTGGTITYSYSGGSNGITCDDGITATLTRTVSPGGIWTYAHTESAAGWGTTITDPQNNTITNGFQGIYLNQEESGSTQTQICYNNQVQPCGELSFTLPITSISTYVLLTNRESESVVNYNTYGLPTEEDDYDFGAPPGTEPGSLIRKTLTTYANLANGIVNMPASITIQNSAGSPVSKTTYTYDQGTPTPTSAPQHLSVTGSRGNVTTISSLVAGSTYLSKTYTYFDTGNIDIATDVNNAQTIYTYGDCGDAFPTTVAEPLGLSRAMTWNCTGGVETAATDENGNTSKIGYTDSYFWRPASSTDQENNATNYTYADQNSMEGTLLFNNSSSTTDILATLDGLGRTLVTQQRQSPGATTLDSVETDYDSLGRPCRTTDPYDTTSGQTDGTPTCSPSSVAATTQTYDALNRPLLTTDGGGGTVTLSYTGNDVLQQMGPQVTGENLKQRQFEYNGIGQLTSVCELTAGTTLAPAGTCGQATSQQGYWTEYTYDVLGDLLTVTQNAQSSTSTQSRTYMYDGLGRTTSESNPETGGISYVYDTDSTCGTSDGDLVKKTDALGNVTCYAYDALHRVTSTTYPSGPNSANTPNKCFVYDAAIDSETVTNTKARLAEAYTTTSACSNTTLPVTVTDEAFSYTPRGEISDTWESTPHSGGYFHVNETYWANGLPDQLNSGTNPLAGLPVLTYGPDGEGRAYTVSASSGQNPVTSTSYNPASEVKQLTFGSTDADDFNYDAVFRMSQYQYNVGGKAVTGVLNWNPNWSLGTLQVTDGFNSSNNQTCSYSADDLARLASANCGSVWSQTFSYDAFGNISKSGSSSFQALYSSSTNQMTKIGSSFIPTYDADGDVTNDGLFSFTWDSAGRPTAIAGVATLTYDALGRMVEQNRSGSYTQFVYDPSGDRLAAMSTTSTLKNAFAPLPSGAKAVYNASGLQLYWHADWLGSWRLSSSPSRGLEGERYYAPFGEQYPSNASILTASFAGNDEDTAADLYDAAYREYEIFGRWPSPDPAGMSAANPMNPQSWNRYAYALNNPLSAIDPTGLDCVYAIGNGDFVVVSGDCLSDTDSGYYVDGTVDSISVFSDGSLAINFGNDDTQTGGTVLTDALTPYNPFSSDYDPFAALQNWQQQNYFNNMQTLFGSQTSTQLTAAVAKGTSLAGHAIPTICGGGVFAFGGLGGNKGGGGVLFELDSGPGFSSPRFTVNGYGEGQNPTNGAGGGAFSNTKNGVNPFLFIPTSEATGIVAFKGGLGGYVGWEGEGSPLEGGFGAYVNITSVSGCH